MVGAVLALYIFGVLQWNPLPWDLPWRHFLAPAFVAPLLPAVGAALGCTCFHLRPRGWPLVRGGAAAMAYFGWAPAVVGLYTTALYYPRYVSASELVSWFGAFAAIMTGAILPVTWWSHRRLLRESSLPREVARRSLLGKLALYYVLAVATAFLMIPQSIREGSRAGGYIIFFLPLPFLLFAVGSLFELWAAATQDQNRIRRDLIVGLAFQAFPLALIALFAVNVLVVRVIPGVYSWRDHALGIEYTDYTLALTPFLGFGMVAVALWILVTEAIAGKTRMAAGPSPF